MPVSLPPELDSLIGQFPQFVQDELRKDPRLGIHLEAERVAGPMSNGCLGWLLRRPTDTPKLDRMVSKYGGYPYLEDPNHWPETGAMFVGQLNFRELPTVGTSLPQQGILLFLTRWWHDDPVVTLWYPEPDASKTADVEMPDACDIPTWECRIAGTAMPSINPMVLESEEWMKLWSKNTDFEILHDRIWDWLYDDGPNVGNWSLDPVSGKDAPFRRVVKKKQRIDELDPSEWVDLWRPNLRSSDRKRIQEGFEGWLAIRRSDLEAGHLHRCEGWSLD